MNEYKAIEFRALGASDYWTGRESLDAVLLFAGCEDFRAEYIRGWQAAEVSGKPRNSIEGLGHGRLERYLK